MKITSSRVAVALGAGVDEERVFLIVPHPVGLKYVPVLHIRKIALMDPTSWWFPGLTDVDEDPIIEQRFFLDNSNLRRHIVKITSSRVAS